MDFGRLGLALIMASPRKDQGLKGKVWVVRESRKNARFEVSEECAQQGGSV